MLLFISWNTWISRMSARRRARSGIHINIGTGIELSIREVAELIRRDRVRGRVEV